MADLPSLSITKLGKHKYVQWLDSIGVYIAQHEIHSYVNGEVELLAGADPEATALHAIRKVKARNIVTATVTDDIALEIGQNI